MPQQSLWTDVLPLVPAYAFMCVVLCLSLVTLWVASGTARARGGIAINPEDGQRFGAPVSETDPPVVARILRAHRNAEAMIYPFLILALLYVLLGGKAVIAIPIFTFFVVARLTHSVLYLWASQPGRTVAFAASLVAVIALLVIVSIAIFWPSSLLLQRN